MQQVAEIRNWTIYKITNPVGNYYIGKTCHFKTRIGLYRGAGKSTAKQPMIYNSIIKYGFENHTIEILDQFDSTNIYSEGKEMFWIRTFMSNISKWRDGKGMNLTDGGNTNLGAKYPNRVSPMKGRKMSESQKLKLSEYCKKNPKKPMEGRNHTAETREKMSLAKKGKPSKLKGRSLSEATKLKLSIINTGRKSPNKGKQLWSEEDKKRIGLSKVGNTYTKGMKWSNDSIAKMRSAKSEKAKTILQFDLYGILIKEHFSSREAAKASGMSRTAISEILSGETKNPKQFIFKYK